MPRIPGGEPWPVDGVAAGSEAVDAGTMQALSTDGTVAATLPVASAAPQRAPVETSTPTAHQKLVGKVLRQGLPRVPGGEPWPADGLAAGTVAEALVPDEAPATAHDVSAVVNEASVHTPVEAEVSVNTHAVSAETPSDMSLRRGLPRIPGGEPWPAEGFAPAQPTKAASSAPQKAHNSVPTPDPAVKVIEGPAPESPVTQSPTSEPSVVEESLVQESEVRPVPVAEQQSAATSVPAPGGAKTAKRAEPKREPIMLGGKTLGRWIKLGVLAGIGAIIVAAILVLAARGLTTFTVVSDFMTRFPGEYDLPDSSDPGFPWWARWSHFLNIFLMVLIIRSGILVRTQQKPPAFWTPKKGGKKISINLWLHTSLDVLWLVNGIIFVVLLFTSGHWMRIVPTSWEVFPNALSAMIQYATLDWPVENGWVNYNSLQQLMYFTVVFIAAPLATITGIRMSEWWPKKAEKLNKIYPAPLARALHFPTMLFFVLFILIHVILVLSTDALKNLNHMFAGTEAVSWTGFWLFAVAIFITAVGWVAARPLVLAPVASLFGKVSNR